MSLAPHFIDNIDPQLAAKIASRRTLFTRAFAGLGATVSAPVVLAVVSQQAFAASPPKEVVDVLNFALTLEYLESEYYETALKKKGLIPAKFRVVFEQIARHELAHVHTLAGALGSAAVKRPKFDFTAKGKYPDVFEKFDTFAAVSNTFEDLGVAAYKGQAGHLKGTAVLTTALQIHSVEARHAAEVRRIRGMPAWDGAFDKPMTKADVLAAAGPFIAG